VIIEKLDLIDYEPLRLGLIASEGSVLAAPEIESFVRECLKPDREGVCGNCGKKWVDAEQTNPSTVDLHVQWLCDLCMEALFTALARQFASIERVQIGYPKSEPIDIRPKAKSIIFKGRSVTFEDCRVEAVADFEIASRAVSVDEFKTFCAETGYVTSGERHRRWDFDDTYDNNAFLNLAEPDERGAAPAYFLSYFDAVEYCTWSKCRLPTEGEYLIAALIDDAVHERLPEPQRIQELWKSGTVIPFGGDVVTSTRVGDLIVSRRGPNVVKRPGWERSGERWLVEKDQPAGQIFAVTDTRAPSPHA
jgi:hypothetical protein